MTHAHPPPAALGAALLFVGACYSPPPLQELAPGPAVVQVEVVARLPVPAHGPTDLRALPDGDILVLDGDHGRLWRLPGAGGDPTATALPPGAATRLAADGDQTWLVGPGAPLRRLGPDLGVVVEVDLGDAAEGLISVAAAGGALRLGDRRGRIWTATPEGELGRGAAPPPANDAAGAAIVDLVPSGDGWLAVDAEGARVLELDAAGRFTGSLGRYGRWAGTLAHPKSALALGEGDVLIADSDLDALQVFSQQGGGLLGLLATADGPLRPAHPVSVRAGRTPDEVLVLDADPAGASVLVLRFGEHARETARETAGVRRLRTRLDDGRQTASAGTCAQCHDGLVRGGQSALDPSLRHHPRDTQVADLLPEGVEVDGVAEDGTLDCGTCHTPHGGGEAFLRRDRAGDALCTGCHTEDAHSRADTAAGGGHKTGAALRDALAARDSADAGGCLACHAPHAAEGEPLLRALDGEQACGTCHADKAETAGSHPRQGALPPTRAAAPTDAHGQVTCRTCHALTDGHGPALLRTPEAQLCTTCHDGVAHGGRGGPACLDCHAAHDAPPGEALLATRPHAGAGDARGCLSCHGDDAHPPGQAGHPVATATGADGQALDCASCHGPHAPAPTGTCADCHETQASAGGHGTATCADCHPAHEAAPTGAGGANPASAPCLACHGPGGGSGGATALTSWTHPTPLFEESAPGWPAAQGLTFFDDNGAPVPPGTEGALACASCHETHGGGIDHLRKDGWKPVCASCHGAESLLLYRGFHADRTDTGPRP